ncbi:MAG: putative Trans-aconitate 2-methyltransferase [Chloroflexi bacterium]|nr:putative Trans-aconitate 2-methyltransferase [Chloroflexota bacterium]
MTTREWDAATYDRISAPQLRWGLAVLERLALAGDERVLDAGCGSGRVTERLLERLPRGTVVALDGSEAMLQEAARRLAPHLSRVELVHADLGQPLPAMAPVDAILSTAVFHWVPDHDALLRHLAAVMRPGGRLVAQCGGAGNVASVLRAACEAGEGWDGPQHFATAGATRRRLEVAGFVEVETWLHEEPTAFEAGEQLTTFLRTVILGAHLERMPPERHDAFVQAVAARLGPHPVVDYVRLNILATRGSPGRRAESAEP